MANKPNLNGKQSFRLIELTLHRFKDEVIPHHESQFKKHKDEIGKLIRTNNLQELKRQTNTISKCSRQIEDLFHELNTLRLQVDDLNLKRFDNQVLPIKESMQRLINNYLVLQNDITEFTKIQLSANDRNQNEDTLSELPHIKIQTMAESNLESQLHQVEALNTDIRDVHEIFANLNEMVNEQREHVDRIETNVEAADLNVSSGLKSLAQAIKTKTATYPVAGAFLGTVIGGPVGSIAGLKIGAVVAVGCGVVGYISGNCIKKINRKEPLNNQVATNSSDTNKLQDKKNA